MAPSIKVVGLYNFVCTSLYWGKSTFDMREAHRAVCWAKSKNLPIKLIQTFEGVISWPTEKSGSD